MIPNGRVQPGCDCACLLCAFGRQNGRPLQASMGCQHFLHLSVTLWPRHLGPTPAHGRAMAQVAVDTGRITPEEAGSVMEGAGVPLLELFLRRGPDGGLQRKLVAVRGSPVEDSKTLGQQVVESLEALDGMEGGVVVQACVQAKYAWL